MTTGRINQVSFYFFSKLGPAVYKVFTRETVKFASRAPNPRDLVMPDLLSF